MRHTIQSPPFPAANLLPLFKALWDFSSEELDEFTRDMTEIVDCYATHRPASAGNAIHRLGQIHQLTIAVSNRYDLLGQMVTFCRGEISNQQEVVSHA